MHERKQRQRRPFALKEKLNCTRIPSQGVGQEWTAKAVISSFAVECTGLFAKLKPLWKR